jgi:lambda family phage portal protein
VKKNIIDKTIEFMAPVRAAKRFKARMFLALTESYAGATKSSRSMYNFNPLGMDADDHLKYERQTLIDRSHDLTRNNAMVSGIIASNCTNIVGAGLKMQSRVDGDFLGLSEEQTDQLETKIEREFRLFSESKECDMARICNFYELQSLALRQFFTTGEALALRAFKKRGIMPYGLKVQLFEPERLCNENNKTDGKTDNGYLYEGVEKDLSGMPLKYWVCSDYPGNTIKRGALTWRGIDAYDSKTGLQNIYHIFQQLRPGQTRGIPYLAPVMESIYNLGKYSKAEMDAAVVAALFTVFITSEAGDGAISPAQPLSETGSKSSDDDVKLNSGAIIGLAPGEKVDTANPGRPNANFDPFIQAILRQIGIALEIPYEVLIKHFTSSYSAARAALLEVWKFYKTRRVWFVNAFCQPIFEAFMYEAVATGRISAPGFFSDPVIRKAYLGTEWGGPTQGHIDPTKEAEAIKIRTEMCLTTMEMETLEYNGGQFDRNMKQIKRELALKKSAGIILDSEPVAPVNNKNYPSDNITDGQSQ